MSSGITAVPSLLAADLTSHVGGRPQAGTATAPPTQAPARLSPNPSLRIDTALALVVIEFRDASGQVESTIPTEQQLEAYRRSGTQGAQADRPAPPGAGQPTSPEGAGTAVTTTIIV